MKVKDFCQCCSYDDYVWKIFVPNPDYKEGDYDLYHEVTVEDLSADRKSTRLNSSHTS